MFQEITRAGFLAGFYALSEEEVVQQEASSVHSSQQLHLQPSSWSSQLDVGQPVGLSEFTRSSWSTSQFLGPSHQTLQHSKCWCHGNHGPNVTIPATTSKVGCRVKLENQSSACLMNLLHGHQHTHSSLTSLSGPPRITAVNTEGLL